LQIETPARPSRSNSIIVGEPGDLASGFVNRGRVVILVTVGASDTEAETIEQFVVPGLNGIRNRRPMKSLASLLSKFFHRSADDRARLVDAKGAALFLSSPLVKNRPLR
jgi:hypothetical protein